MAAWRVRALSLLSEEDKDAAKHPTPEPQRFIQQGLSAELSLRTPRIEVSDWKPEVKLSSLLPSRTLQALAMGNPLPL